MKNSKTILITLLVVLLSLGFASTTLGNEGEPPPPDEYPGSLLTSEPRTVESIDDVRWPWLTNNLQLAISEEESSGESLYEPKVINGSTVTSDGLYPFIVSYKYYGVHVCGGVLINQNWVLTAAHCWVNPSNGLVYPFDSDTDRIILGERILSVTSNIEQSIPISEVHIHPQFKSSSGNLPYLPYDFALLKLASPAVLNDYVKPIKLATSTQGSLANYPATILGWGYTDVNIYPIYDSYDNVTDYYYEGYGSADTLQAGSVTILPDTGCSNYGSSYGPVSQFCANGPITQQSVQIKIPGTDPQEYEWASVDVAVDTCIGDSGGPVVVNISGTLYAAGITSWGHSCADPDYPGVYAKISSSINWVYSVLGITIGSPAITAPTGTITDSSPTYQWDHLSLASEYRLAVKDSSNAVLIWKLYAAANICSGGVCSVDPGITLSDGMYTTWVKSTSPVGEWGSRSFSINSAGAVPPEAVTIVAPIGAITDSTPDYQWNHITGASSYRFTVKDANENQVIWKVYQATEVCSGSTCSSNPGVVLADGYYSVWVQAVNLAGYGPWASKSFALNVGPVSPPGTPTLIHPIGSTTDSTPEYQWNHLSEAAFYRFAIKNQGGTIIFWKVYNSTAICTSSICSTVPLNSIPLANGDYSFWIQATNIAGNGMWASNNFTINSEGDPPPGVTTIIAPSGSISDSTPDYQWNHLPEATGYRFAVKDNTETIVIWKVYSASTICSGSLCSINPGIVLPSGSYSTWVQATNSSGYGFWTSKSFVIN